MGDHVLQVHMAEKLHILFSLHPIPPPPLWAGHSARPSWSRRTFDRARGFFGRVQHSFSVVQPRASPSTDEVPYRHTFDGSTNAVPERHSHQSSRDSGGRSRGTSLL